LIAGLTLQFRFGSREIAQAFLPLRFQAARNQSVSGSTARY
jgi:hypothetical protein